MTATCETCRWWLWNTGGDGTKGNCTVPLPPHFLLMRVASTATAFDDYCALHQPKETRDEA